MKGHEIGFPPRQKGIDNIPYEYRIGSYTYTNDEGEEAVYVGVYRVWYRPNTKVPYMYDKDIVNMNYADPKELFKDVKRLQDAFKEPIIPLEETFHSDQQS